MPAVLLNVKDPLAIQLADVLGPPANVRLKLPLEPRGKVNPVIVNVPVVADVAVGTAA